MEKLIFKKIQKENIFRDDFIQFSRNNEIEFKKVHKNNIAVLYGPNGTGKTSLSKVLKNKGEDESAYFEAVFKGKTYNNNNNDLFHIISDQNGRNIIEGTAKDYLLGDNIKKEHNLKIYIDDEFTNIHKQLKKVLKDDFSISTVKNSLINEIKDENLRVYTRKLANSRYDIKELDKEKFLKYINQLNYENIDILDSNKYDFVKQYYKDEKSIIYQIKTLNTDDIKINQNIQEIEENDEAIKILNRFSYKHECVVCDNNNYNPVDLIKKKKLNKDKIINQLDETTKKILEGIIKSVKKEHNDPLDIENILIDSIKTGDINKIIELKGNIEYYLDIFNKDLNNKFIDNVSENLIRKFNEYKDIISRKPDISDEDILYITKIVSENIGKSIDIKRDSENESNLKILLSGKELLQAEREDLHLSTGQQNFISLAFELLKARNSNKKIIVLDDPISSFDSIYKNKIVYCIIKFLEGKHQIILTHNTDLIRLLEFQLRNCFNLYMFNNSEDALNGFIKVEDREKDILLQINKLLNLFREEIYSEIEDEKGFLISMIPFMRGYANIVGNSKSYTKLSKVMHGYETESINISNIYNELFAKTDKDDNQIVDDKDDKKIVDDVIVSVEDILKINLDEVKILKNNNYPLLNKTLYHTMNYLFLRLKVEKELQEIFHIEIDKNLMLHQIISKAFRGNDKETLENRVFFTSRKTLLNEFNHFEGNMNIFQPAIDITDTALKKEKETILNKLKELRLVENIC